MTWRDHPALPPPPSQPWVVAAALTFVAAVLVGYGLPGFAVAAALVMGCIAWRRPVAAVALILILVSATARDGGDREPLPEGAVRGVATLVTEVRQGRYGPWALVEIGGHVGLADLPDPAAGQRGELVWLEGSVSPVPGEAAGRRHDGTIRVDEYRLIAAASSPIIAAGNAMRARVRQRLAPLEEGRGLLAGFLVGDVSGVDEADQEAMRRSGLSHFTAVSGSNVALYLLLVYLVLGPFSIGPRRRAVIGILALPPFMAATGFEPSVLRASAMAGIVLLGRMFSVAAEPWQVLSGAVVGLLVLDPSLAHSVGFQLSVAATAGVIVGARWPGVEGWAGRALSVSVGAQLAVAPLLVAAFGRIPLLSPLVNLVAAPVVTAATLVGALGVVGPEVLIHLGSGLAGMVLALARLADPWPQLGWPGLLGLVTVLSAWLTLPSLREWLAVGLSLTVAGALLIPSHHPPEPGMVVFDVGQGDAILLAGGHDSFALVDGGPDPRVLIDRLRRYGVTRLDLVVLTHVHADHATGLADLPGRVPIGMVWERTEPHVTSASVELMQALGEHQIPVHRPEPGEVWTLGELSIEVEAPLRRYASPNDQSIVLTVRGRGRSALLAGDIETVAQAELSDLAADVLKVPHQGAATSEAEWLAGVGAELAVISVGRNEFGHPAQWVIAVLERSGAEVLRTDQVGDVVIPLGQGDGRLTG